MARRHESDFDRVFNFARTALFIQPLSDTMTAALEDEGLAVDPDEPPDHAFTQSPQTYHSAVVVPQTSEDGASGTYTKKFTTPMSRQSSLLTEGLLTAVNLKNVAVTQNTFMSRAGSQASAYSLTSNHGLTSDGGMSSPTRSGTPSPPLPPALTTAPASKTRTIKFAGEKSVTVAPAQAASQSAAFTENKPRKMCISFACPPPKLPEQAKDVACTSAADGNSSTNTQKRSCTIKFACDAKPDQALQLSVKPAPTPLTASDVDLQTTPKPVGFLVASGRRSRGSQSTIVTIDEAGIKSTKVTSGEAVSPTEVRNLEKKKKPMQLGATRPEDEAWMTDNPKPRKPITVSDTLRKENAIRKLAEEASQELDEDYDIDDIVDDDEDEDLPATGSRYMAYDEDESDGGHETDDEEGFADSDSDGDDDPDFQFWTTSQATGPMHADHPELLKPHHHRTVSESSLESQFRQDSSSAAPKAFLSGHGMRRRRSPKEIKMRPGTPELPDSTDFVCGTLDEDRPLEEAYMSCLKQRTIEKRGIIPQDLDPSFPTSDPENIDEEEEDEITEGLASTASDHHFLGGRFDESDASQGRGRGSRTRPIAVLSRSPRRLHSPPPPKSRLKSPLPKTVQSRAKSPAPRKLFGMSPIRAKSPAPARMVSSPPASPKRITFRAPQLGQRRTPVRTASLPHTPNPFFIAQERKMRARAKKQLVDQETHDRGPIDIKQGLEARKQRRKEHYWRKHCRDHKDKSRRCAPGRGAERMRELGIEVSHRTKAYGQKLQLMLSA